MNKMAAVERDSKERLSKQYIAPRNYSFNRTDGGEYEDIVSPLEFAR